MGSISLLNLNFNRFWANAYNRRETDKIGYFAMQHDDIKPQSGWADVLIDELERTGADMVSAVVPIKDPRGLTSTGIRNWLTGDIRRLTMRELPKLPETFDIDDCLCRFNGLTYGGDEILIVNTGLWVCRFDREWVDRFPGFRCVDQVRVNPDGKREAVCLPEDWLFSEWLARQGAKVFATTKVPLLHLDGEKEYPNFGAWGEWETDKGDTPKT